MDWKKIKVEPFDAKQFEERMNKVLAQPLEPELIEICKALAKK